MYKLIPILILLLLSAVIKVDSLECYVCDKCSEVKEEHLLTCGSETTTSTTTSSPGTGSTGSSTVTLSSTSSTGGSSTAPPSSESTTASSTTTSSTAPPTSESTTASTTTSSTAPPTSESTTASTTTSSTAPPISDSDSPADPAGKLAFQVNRVKREAIRVQERATEYVCVTVKYEDNIYRGCAVDTGKVCETSVANVTCTTCKTDKCNSAASIQVSTILIFAAAILKFV